MRPIRGRRVPRETCPWFVLLAALKRPVDWPTPTRGQSPTVGPWMQANLQANRARTRCGLRPRSCSRGVGVLRSRVAAPAAPRPAPPRRRRPAARRLAPAARAGPRRPAGRQSDHGHPGARRTMPKDAYGPARAGRHLRRRAGDTVALRHLRRPAPVVRTGHRPVQGGRARPLAPAAGGDRDVGLNATCGGAEVNTAGLPAMRQAIAGSTGGVVRPVDRGSPSPTRSMSRRGATRRARCSSPPWHPRAARSRSPSTAIRDLRHLRQLRGPPPPWAWTGPDAPGVARPGARS